MTQCETCKPRPDEKNHPRGMIFVGWGQGWQTCPTCGGTGSSVEAAPARPSPMTNTDQLPLDFAAPPTPAIPVPPPIVTPAQKTVADVLAGRALKPRRKRGSPGPADVESAGRDEALDKLEEARSALIAEARKVARQLAIQRGRVTSVEVFQALRSYGYDLQLDSADSRWMGCVFRSGGEWQKLGYESTGSHKRPVAIWRLL